METGCDHSACVETRWIRATSRGRPQQRSARRGATRKCAAGQRPEATASGGQGQHLGFARTIFMMMPGMLDASKGLHSALISYSTHPSAQMSLLLSYGLPCTTWCRHSHSGHPRQHVESSKCAVGMQGNSLWATLHSRPRGVESVGACAGARACLWQRRRRVEIAAVLGDVSQGVPTLTSGDR